MVAAFFLSWSVPHPHLVALHFWTWMKHYSAGMRSGILRNSWRLGGATRKYMGVSFPWGEHWLMGNGRWERAGQIIPAPIFHFPGPLCGASSPYSHSREVPCAMWTWVTCWVSSQVMGGIGGHRQNSKLHHIAMHCFLAHFVLSLTVLGLHLTNKVLAF